MKIFMLHPHDLYSELEPWTIRILSFAHEFAKKGHDVKIGYFPRDSDKIPPPSCYEGMQTIPLNRKISVILLIKNFIQIYRLIGWADVVHLQKSHHYAAIPLLSAALLRGKPIHYDWDDWEKKIFLHSNKKSITTLLVYSFFGVLEKFIPLIADTVSVSSRRLSELCLNLGIAKERIFMAHVGADLEKFHPHVSGQEVKKRYNLQDPLVLYLGQLHDGQYVELFIKSAEVVLEHCPQTKFMIIGGGSRFNDLKNLVKSLAIEKNIIFTNSIPHSAIPTHIAAADVCVACFEDNDITRCKSPLKIAEYLASGKAIVASNVGEVRNMVGGAGILTEAGNSVDLAGPIIKVLKDEALRIQMGLRARERSLRKYNWRVSAENLLKAYDMALYLKNITLEEVLIPARDFNRGNLAADNDSFGKRLAIDTGIFPCFAEYDFYLPGEGKYELWVKYAADTPRPCKIYFNGKLLCAEGLKDTSGGWRLDKAKWFKQAELEMESKFHILKFISQGHLPHLEVIKFKKYAHENSFY